MNLNAAIDKTLTDVELCISQVADSLVSGESVALESASGALRQAASALAEAMNGLAPIDQKDASLRARFKKIARAMATQRETLIRRTVMVDLALNTLVPGARSATYAQAAGPYGAPGKSSGAFKYLAA